MARSVGLVASRAAPEDPPRTFVLVKDAAGLGLSRHNLLTGGRERLSRGLYAPRVAARYLVEVTKAVSEVLPRDSGFGHLTSCALRGWWLPNRLRAHVLLATTTSRVHVQRQGVYVRRSRFAEFDEVDGVPLVSGPGTLVELARDLLAARR